MSEVVLKRIDVEIGLNKEQELSISPPVIIGRGPTLKCGEKKISRNHGTIDWDDDGILITSTHINPIYLKMGGETKTLSKGESKVLLNGDEFGLLDDAFWFKVIFTCSEPSNKDINKGKKKEEDTSPEVKKNKEINSPIKNLKNSFLKPEENAQIQNVKSLRDETEDPEKTRKISKQKLMLEHDEKSNIPNGKQNDEKSLSKLNELEDRKFSSLINSTIISDKFETKKVEESDNLEESTSSMMTKASNCESRTRVLPKWMMKGVAEDSKNNGGKTHKTQTPISHGRCSKSTPKKDTGKATNIIHKEKDCKEDQEKHATKTKRAQATMSKAKQYHTISQDFEDDVNEKKTLNICKPQSISSDEEENSSSLKREMEGVTPRPQNAMKKSQLDSPKVSPRKRTKKNKPSPSKSKDYHFVSQDFNDSNEEEETTETGNIHTLSSDEEESEDSPSSKATSKGKESHQKNEGVTSPLKRNRPRKSCEYGAQCYRKNPDHKRSVAHPGDDDYASPNEEMDDSDDDRPECEFGVKCFRKNPQHKKDFKHTRNPQPQRQVKRKAKLKQKEANDEHDTEDDYDFDDPFLNDDSSDDYAPTDSSHSDWDMGDAAAEEDTKRMIKEANKFVKKRKR